MRSTLLFLSLISLSLAACGDTSPDGTNYDPTLLEQYRRALPKAEALTAKTPVATDSSRAVGDPADYPNDQGIKDLVAGVNGAATGIVELMKTIVQLPPTLYNSETQEFLWGPWENEDGFGTVMAYVKDEPEGADFDYSYALMRGVDNNINSMVPIVWGGATPDPEVEEYGSGVTLWDFEANYAFEVDNEQPTDNLDRGRFVALYAHDEDAENPGNDGAWVYAMFRKWVPKDAPEGQQPAAMDYLYGHYNNNNDGHHIDFLDVDLQTDVGDGSSDVPDGTLENISLTMAFLDSGLGRAEGAGSGGSLDEGQTFGVTECWDAALDRTYFHAEVTDPSAGWEYSEPAGADESACGFVFQNSIAELGLPTLDGIDPALRSCFESVANDGLANGDCE